MRSISSYSELARIHSMCIFGQCVSYMEIKIPCSVELCLSIVHELRSYGLLQGPDFSFSFNPRVDTWAVYEPDESERRVSQSYMAITFTSEASQQYRTLLELKYGGF